MRDRCTKIVFNCRLLYNYIVRTFHNGNYINSLHTFTRTNLFFTNLSILSFFRFYNTYFTQKRINVLKNNFLNITSHFFYLVSRKIFNFLGFLINLIRNTGPTHLSPGIPNDLWRSQHVTTPSVVRDRTLGAVRPDTVVGSLIIFHYENETRAPAVRYFTIACGLGRIPSRRFPVGSIDISVSEL